MFKPFVEKLNSMRVILASSAPQRRSMLEVTSLKFEVCPSTFEENLKPEDYTFSQYVEETAFGKANEVYERLKDNPIKPDIVIGFDTMVTYEGRMYGKPKNKDEAFSTIKELTSCGIPNSVYTGVAIIYKGHIEKFTEVSTVYMAKLTDKEILAYIESGEPMKNAGCYAIQGNASTFIHRIEGDYYNIIGLPLFKLTQKLKELVLN